MKAIALLLSLAAFPACAGSHTVPDRPPSTVTFEGSEAVLYVDVADTPSARRRGLMGVADLPSDQGMAFVFDDPASSTFWMKDTLIPLSIAFVDQSGEVITIREMEPCGADPCPTYAADRPYVLAIEANQGWFEDRGIRVGDRADLEVMAYP
jgi:uncharacterized membrane protein (UPF0127 family)